MAIRTWVGGKLAAEVAGGKGQTVFMVVVKIASVQLASRASGIGWLEAKVTRWCSGTL